MKNSLFARLFAVFFLIFSFPVHASNSEFFGTDFDEKIFSYGAEFSKQYNDFLYTNDFSILMSAVQNVEAVSNSYTSTREYKRISQISRDFRYLFERIDADIAYLKTNMYTAEKEQIQFFSQDLLQTLLKLNSYRMKILNQYQEEKFSKIVRNGIIITLALFFLIFLLIIRSVLLKNKLLSNEYETKQSEAFAQAVFQAQEDERNRLSNELHDTVAQEIRAIRLKSEIGAIDEVSELSTHCMNEIRSICYNLMPPDLKLADGTAGIDTIFSFLCSNFQKQNNIPCNFSAQENLPQITDQKILLNLFRIVQEALNNVAKHAEAESCSVSIRTGKNSLIIFITDDGKGFDPASAMQAPERTEKSDGKLNTPHFGLKSMKNRAELIGASIEINSEQDDGTEIRIELPL